MPNRLNIQICFQILLNVALYVANQRRLLLMFTRLRLSLLSSDNPRALLEEQMIEMG
jgi:hypothetical protein